MIFNKLTEIAPPSCKIFENNKNNAKVCGPWLGKEKILIKETLKRLFHYFENTLFF